MRSRKDKTTYYHTLLGRIILAVSITLLVLSLSLYISFEKFTLDYIYKSNLNSLQQIGNNVVQVNKYSNAYTASLFNNPSSQQLMFTKNPNIADVLHNLDDLYSQINSAPFVRSLEIYNGHNNKVYLIGTDVSLIRSLNTCIDRDFPGLIEKYTNNLLNPFARMVALTPYNSDKADVLTYIISERATLNGKPRNAIALNVNVNWIFNAVHSTYGKAGVQNIYLIDHSGLVKASTQKKYFKSNFSSKPFFRQLMNRRGDSGCFIIGTGLDKVLLSYKRLHDPDWTIVEQTPYRYIAASIIKVRIIIAIISALTILLGLLISLAFSRKLYLPIHSLMQSSISLFHPEAQENGSLDEFEQITRTIVTASNEIRSLRHFENKSLQVLQQDFLRLVLLTPNLDPAMLEAKVNELRLSIGILPPIWLVLYKLDHYHHFKEINSEYERIILKFGFTNISKEIISQKFACEMVDMGGDHIVGIIYSGHSAKEAVEAELKNLNEKIVSVIDRNFSIGLSVFVGAACERPEEVSDAYRELCAISGYRFVLGHRCTLFRDELEGRNFESLDPFTLNLNPLLDALKLCNLEKINNSYELIESELYRCRCDDVLKAISYISSMVFHTLCVIENNGNFVLNESYAEFNSSLVRAETLKETKVIFFDLFARIVEKISTDRNNRSAQVIQNVTLYIKQNYLRVNISSNTIAEQFGLTPDYLNKIFRESQFESISEYITHLKISKACDFLSGSNIALDDILKKIGWSNKNYFFTVFKKITGVTPMEYRIKAKNHSM